MKATVSDPLEPKEFGLTAIETGRWTTALDDVGSGPPLVLIHGLTLDRRMWLPQIAASRGYHRVIAYDMIGHGDSSQPDSYPPDDYSEQLLALMDALDVQQAHVAGLSMGAAVALRTALTAPARIASLILANPYIFRMPFPPEACFVSSPHRVFRKLARCGDADAARREWCALEMFAPALQHPVAGPTFRTMVAHHRLGPWRDGSRHEEPDDWNALTRISCPTLVITSERDDPGFAHAAIRAATAIPGAQLAAIAEAGHLSSMEAPDQFSALLNAFLVQIQTQPGERG